MQNNSGTCIILRRTNSITSLIVSRVNSDICCSTTFSCVLWWATIWVDCQNYVGKLFPSASCSCVQLVGVGMHLSCVNSWPDLWSLVVSHIIIMKLNFLPFSQLACPILKWALGGGIVLCAWNVAIVNSKVTLNTTTHTTGPQSLSLGSVFCGESRFVQPHPFCHPV